MNQHITISATETADRLAIRELIEAYARCAARHDAKGQMALFTRDTHLVVYMNVNDPKPSLELRSRDALGPVFADLNRYDAAASLLGRSTIFTLTANRCTSTLYWLGHQDRVEHGRRRMMVAWFCYFDTFRKIDGAWFFSERLLYVDWLEQRARHKGKLNKYRIEFQDAGHS